MRLDLKLPVGAAAVAAAAISSGPVLADGLFRVNSVQVTANQFEFIPIGSAPITTDGTFYQSPFGTLDPPDAQFVAALGAVLAEDSYVALDGANINGGGKPSDAAYTASKAKFGLTPPVFGPSSLDAKHIATNVNFTPVESKTRVLNGIEYEAVFFARLTVQGGSGGVDIPALSTRLLTHQGAAEVFVPLALGGEPVEYFGSSYSVVNVQTAGEFGTINDLYIVAEPGDPPAAGQTIVFDNSDGTFIWGATLAGWDPKALPEHLTPVIAPDSPVVVPDWGLHFNWFGGYGGEGFSCGSSLIRIARISEPILAPFDEDGIISYYELYPPIEFEGQSQVTLEPPGAVWAGKCDVYVDFERAAGYDLVDDHFIVGLRVEMADGPHAAWVEFDRATSTWFGEMNQSPYDFFSNAKPVRWGYQTSPFLPAEIPSCDADFDGSGAVDSTDLNTLLAVFGCTSSCFGADVDGDGDVDSADLNVLLAEFGDQC